MSKNWIRYISIVAEGGGKKLELASMRCRFKIKQFTNQTVNLGDIRITNLAPETVKPFIQKEFRKITVEAGYADNHAVIFTGDIVQARSGRESPTDTYLDIFARDGVAAHNHATVSKTFAAGSTPKDHYNEALRSMKGFGSKAGFLGVDLSTPKYPRAVTLYGMARDVLRTIAESKEASWSTQNGEVQMVGYKQSLPGGATILNSDTGLVGMPTQEIGGVKARVLINPKLKVNSSVKIDEASIQKVQLYRDVVGGTDTDPRNYLIPKIAADGIYKILQIDIEGDTRGNPWYMDLTCLAVGETNIPKDLFRANSYVTKE